MTHLGLFEGIGGFSLAARWMGWETLAWCEWNEFGQKVLRYHFPEAEGFGDITKTDFTKYANRIDILTGGFPCQPYSVAGKRKGKEDERHLWPEMLRAIREVRPRWIVGENVSGLVSWNGGMVFNEVQADLEVEGYEVAPFLLPACSKNAPHKRERVWFIAYSKSGYAERSRRSGNKEWNGDKEIWEGLRNELTSNGSSGLTTNANSIEVLPFCEAINKRQKYEPENRAGIWTNAYSSSSRTDWSEFPTVTPICNGNDGLSGKLDGITFSKWRTESIKAGGNAIVPQVALEIFKSIEAYENLIKK